MEGKMRSGVQQQWRGRLFLERTLSHYIPLYPVPRSLLTADIVALMCEKGGDCTTNIIAAEVLTEKKRAFSKDICPCLPSPHLLPGSIFRCSIATLCFVGITLPLFEELVALAAACIMINYLLRFFLLEQEGHIYDQLIAFTAAENRQKELIQ
jgi:hypothetical protein